MKRVAVLVMLAMTIIPTRIAWAHGIVGDYMFLEPLIADDANPKNEFDILKPFWYRTADGREFGLEFSLEKVFLKDRNGNNLVSVEFGGEWDALSPKDGPYLTGFNDFEMLPKIAIYTNPEHEMRFSMAAKIVLPTGNPSVQDQNHTQLGPEFLWAKGFGDIPNRPYLKFLRPFGFQGDVGYTPALGGAPYHELFADNVVEYSLPYLSNNVKDIGLRWPLRNLFLFTEFNYDQLLTGPPGETFPDVRATPGIAFVGRYLQISLATQVPLNSATVPADHAAVLGLLDLYLDDIFPQTSWAPQL